MQYEVEQKFRSQDLSAMKRKLQSLGGQIDASVIQADQYFAHPVRDFASTDEALRIRRVGSRNWVTYKGPKIDSTSKTRQEIEVSLAPGDEGADQFAALLDALGFRPVATVSKQRQRVHLQWQGRDCEAALDTVDGLGEFVELEFGATEDDLTQAGDCLRALAEQLDLAESERRSYLELLLERTDQ
jgi:adenylate cyclase class 2